MGFECDNCGGDAGSKNLCSYCYYEIYDPRVDGKLYSRREHLELARYFNGE